MNADINRLMPGEAAAFGCRLCPSPEAGIEENRKSKFNFKYPPTLFNYTGIPVFAPCREMPVSGLRKMSKTPSGLELSPAPWDREIA